jgi:hypothetical protein
MNNILPLIIFLIVFAACNDTAKKVVVMSKGQPEINTNDNTITSKDGNSHEEKMFVLGSGSYTFKLNTPAGEATVELKDNGLYVINVKNDTIVGSYQPYTSASQSNATITQVQLKHKIDSLQMLIENKNVTPANRNFFILPKYAAKISDNMDAEVVGPYHQMRSAEKVNGKDPEIYRFYSIKEIREMIGKLQALTVAEKI